jgi:hypothetical protein
MRLVRKVFSKQHKLIVDLNKECRKAEEDMQGKDEIIRDLREELFVLREKVRNAAMIKVRFAYRQ